MDRGNGIKENGNEQQRAGGEGGKVKQNCYIANNVPLTAFVILSHSEYVQFHIVMINTVQLRYPAASSP